MNETDFNAFKKARYTEPRERFPVFQHPKSNYGRRAGTHVFRLIEHEVSNGEKRPAYLQHDPQAVYCPATWTHKEAFMSL